MDNKQLAQSIIDALGGKNNIQNYWHCITRLRFNIKDDSLMNIEKIEALSGVLGAQTMGNQFQIIIGSGVPKVYAAMQEELGDIVSGEVTDAKIAHKKNFSYYWNMIIDTISGIFTPILPAIVGGGVLKGLLALLLVLGVLQETSGTYEILALISDAPFYFLPFLLAVTSARKFKTSEFLAVMLAGCFMYPTLLHAAEGVESILFLGVIPIPVMAYSTSVLPIIFSTWLLSYVNKYVERFIPDIIRNIFAPVITMLIVVPIALWLIGPIGTYLGVFVEMGITWLFTNTGPVAGIVFCGLMPLIVMTGMHYSFFPTTFNSFAINGYDLMLLPMSLISNMALAGATFGVMIKSGDKKMKSLAASTGFSALFGVTEPAIYGVNLKLKKPFYAALIGGAVGGGYASFAHLKTFSFAQPGITSFPLYVSPEGGANFINMIISVVLGFVVAFVVTIITLPKNEESASNVATPVVTPKKIKDLEGTLSIQAPITGKVTALSNVPDPTFANEIIGKGIAIEPTDETVYAPFSGVVSIVAPTKHAIGLIDDNGLELLIHIGLETVSLNGSSFETFVEQGQRVETGDKLIKFDSQAIKDMGISLITPIVITNPNEYFEIVCTSASTVTAKEDSIIAVMNK